MALPSYIPRYDSVDLLDLDQVPYLIAQSPPTATLRAWAKLQETERRWTMFDWATFVIHDPQRNSRLMTDFASAYLLSFEATLQVLMDERFPTGFETWLSSQPPYDLECRGLRTLRHLEAHIRPGSLAVQPHATTQSRFAGTHAGGTVAWHWEPITSEDFAALNSPRLSTSELATWNARAGELLTLALMRHGLQALKSLLLAAGP